MHDKSVSIKDISKKAGVSAATIYKLKETKIASCFIKRGKKVRHLFVQDNDPVQNCASVRQALNTLKAKQLRIPPCSPHINTIENSMREELRQQALQKNITHETFGEFSKRVTTSKQFFHC